MNNQTQQSQKAFGNPVKNYPLYWTPLGAAMCTPLAPLVVFWMLPAMVLFG